MGKEKEKTTTQTRTLPGYVNDYSKQLMKMGSDIATKPFENYTGDRVADFSTDTTRSFQNLRDMVSNSPIVLPEALDGARKYAAAPAQKINTERVVDEGGRLGAIADYINPNVMAALMPALRKISESADSERLNVNSAATMSGAFGDARHGIRDVGVTNAETQAHGDTTAKFMNDAFDRAMAARTGDLNRFGLTDTTNANFAEKALDRGFQGSGAVLDRTAQDQNMKLQQIQALLSAGGMQDAQKQKELDAKYQEFIREYGHDFNAMNAFATALRAPTDVTTTGTTTEPDNSLWGLAGSIAGKAIPALLTGGASLPFTMDDESTMGNESAMTGGMSSDGWSSTGGGWNPSVSGGYVYPRYADGGRPEVGKPAVVGERGPEVFVPDEAGTVIPNEVMQMLMALLEQITSTAPQPAMGAR